MVKEGLGNSLPFALETTFFMPTASEFCSKPILWHDFANHSEILGT